MLLNAGRVSSLDVFTALLRWNVNAITLTTAWTFFFGWREHFKRDLPHESRTSFPTPSFIKAAFRR